MGLFISPLVSIEAQVERKLEELGIIYVSLTQTPPCELKREITIHSPKILITNVEAIASAETQRAIRCFPLVYIAIDECQVLIQNTLIYIYSIIVF